MNDGLPRPGAVLRIGPEASIQFRQPILLRVIRVHDWLCDVGWVWVDGYQLNPVGDAIARRTIYVQTAGLRPVPSRT